LIAQEEEEQNDRTEQSLPYPHCFSSEGRKRGGLTVRARKEVNRTAEVLSIELNIKE
jgi:hypothetical protein